MTDTVYLVERRNARGRGWRTILRTSELYEATSEMMCRHTEEPTVAFRVLEIPRHETVAKTWHGV